MIRYCQISSQRGRVPTQVRVGRPDSNKTWEGGTQLIEDVILPGPTNKLKGGFIFILFFRVPLLWLAGLRV